MTRVRITGPKGTVEIEVPKAVAADGYSTENMTVTALLERAVHAYNEIRAGK